MSENTIIDIYRHAPNCPCERCEKTRASLVIQDVSEQLVTLNTNMTLVCEILTSILNKLNKN